MRSLFYLNLLLAPLVAQDLEKGAQLFRTTCAQGYCHGSGGTQGRAPRLIGRNFDGPTAAKIAKDGVPNTGMPGFGQRLSGAELDAVVAYVVKISGGDMNTLTASSGAGAASAMPAGAKRGKELFFDAVRGVNRCGTCHAMEGMGVAVGPNLGVSGDHPVDLIRNGRPAGVRLATTVKTGDKWPSLVVEQTGEVTRAYDLSVSPPMLRTLLKGDATFASGSPWRHSNAVKNYTGDELAAVAEYLQWAARQ